MIRIKPTQKVNPRGISAPKMYYARAVASGNTDLERLAYLVARQSSVNEGDCYNVILTLVDNIIDELEHGKIVKLDRLGALQIGVSSTAAESEVEVTSHSVTKSRINFRPDVRLKRMLKNLKYTIAE